MNNNINKSTKNILNAIIYVVLVLSVLIIGIKLCIFFLPFIVAYIIYIITRPLYRFLKNKLKIKSKLADILAISIFYIIVSMIVLYIAALLISQIYRSVVYLPNIANGLKNVIESTLNDLKMNIPVSVVDVINKALQSIFSYISNVGFKTLTILKYFVSNFPTYLVNIIIIILATFLFTENKEYMKNIMDKQLPKVWIEKIELIKTQVLNMLIGYFKAQSIIICLCFLEMYISFSIVNRFVYNFNYVFLASFIVAFIDALPVLGAGAVLIPSAIIMFALKNTSFGIALLIMYAIATISRQTLEPKLVSNNLGANPLLTLISMFAGFKLFGVLGFILGPMFMMILKILFSRELEYGFFKFLSDDESDNNTLKEEMEFKIDKENS